jgi:glutathione S-transferase
MLTLYHAPRTRASRIIWLLEEIGELYEIKTVPIRGAKDDRFMAEYRLIHPHGKVPALQHNRETIFESAAIALYLTDAFPKAKLGPKVGEPKRGAYLTWLAYYAGVMEPAFVTKAQGLTTSNPAQVGWAPPDDILAYIAEALKKGPYLLGEKFSAADIIYGATFALFIGSPLLPVPERFKPYVERLTARPAYARAQAKEAA